MAGDFTTCRGELLVPVPVWIPGSSQPRAPPLRCLSFDPVKESVSHVPPCLVQCWGRQASVIRTLQRRCLAFPSQRPCAATHITSSNMMQTGIPFSSFFGALILFFQATTGRCAVHAFALQASEQLSLCKVTLPQSSPVLLQQICRHQKAARSGFGFCRKGQASSCKECKQLSGSGIISEDMIRSRIPWFVGALLLLFQATTGGCSRRPIPKEAMQSVAHEL
ncbi:unnamed protein product [Symbiodinium sp. CCMP2592]|nr:unnamed protein product [Symbiodinium sp. CCMP2592]